VVTFDDGFASTLRARPILDEMGFPATVFIVTRFIESGEHLCWPGIEGWLDGEHADELRPLAWNELDQLVDRGWEVGSHTVSHPHLPDLDEAELESELGLSLRTITKRLGKCETIAYPYGRADERVAAVASEVGYSAGCTFTPVYRTDEPHRRCRIGLTAADTGLRLRAKLSRATLAWRYSRLGAGVDGIRLHYRDRRSGLYFRDRPTRVASTAELGLAGGDAKDPHNQVAED
jgi:peptidoglycan/xylan/chitin deacetylase (PgdA/CDA1 family)